jgi:hypothetical protein
MSQGNINRLLELWHISLAEHGSFSPFINYKHIYDTIDAIEEGRSNLDKIYSKNILIYFLLQVMHLGSVSKLLILWMTLERMAQTGNGRNMRSGFVTQIW